jgi:hypothetical protein
MLLLCEFKCPYNEIQTVSKRALQVLKLVYIYSEDMCSVFNTPSFAWNSYSSMRLLCMHADPHSHPLLSYELTFQRSISPPPSGYTSRIGLRGYEEGGLYLVIIGSLLFLAWFSMQTNGKQVLCRRV